MTDATASAVGREEALEKTFTIIVNAEKKTVDSEVLSYDQVVALAFPNPRDPNTIFTITFRKAEEPHEGTLVEGQSVEIKVGTIFDVTPTGKS